MIRRARSRRRLRRWRRRHRRTRFVPYQSLFRDDRKSTPVERAEQILTDGWTLGRFEPVVLEPPLPWDELATTARSWSYHLHSWRPLMVLLAAHSQIPDRSLIERCLAVVDDWRRSFEHGAPDGSFAWYDMAVGTRADVLACLIDVMARDATFELDEIESLIELARRHDVALTDPDQFAAHSNHGLYQAAGQMALAQRLGRLPGFSSTSLGERRMVELVESHFAADGIHLEHSPGYHDATLRILDRILGSGLVTDPRLFEARSRIERALTWFVLPNGTLAMFGDTDHRRVVDPPRMPAAAATGEMEFVRSGGEAGVRPRDSIRAFDQGGYFVARSGWPAPPEPAEDAAYLAQIAGFHSRTHKHADDLSIVWYDRGREILVDAGRYGYQGRTEAGSTEAEQGFWYSDPRRMYVESTRAHNTVQIDGADHGRKGRRPYGSALGRWGESSGIAFAESHVRHGPIRHARVLFMAPGRWLAVIDWLWDNEATEHRYRQWFHFAPELGVAASESGVTVDAADWGPLQVIDLGGDTSPLAPVRGQEQPELQGWWAPRPGQFDPNWATGFEAVADRHTFVTLLAFGSEVVSDICSIAPSGRRGQIGWSIDGVASRLEFERPEGGDFVVAVG